MSIQISAIICTHNQDRYIGKSISSLFNQSLNRKKYEIIVIDNASDDNTEGIVKELFSEQENTHYIYEPKLGLSSARNTGWRNAKGSYVAYLDDDALADVDWLSSILYVFKNVRPTPGITGGKIDPVWESTPPEWLSDKMKRSLTIIDWSDSATVINNTHMWLAGANIAYNKSLLSDLGGFDESLGRKGTNLLSCEETLLNANIQKAGYNIYYDPKIRVKHHIPSTRLKKYWHIKRHFWNGVSIAYIDKHTDTYKNAGSISNLLFGISMLAKNISRTFFNNNNGGDKLLQLVCELSYTAGYIRGIFR